MILFDAVDIGYSLVIRTLRDLLNRENEISSTSIAFGFIM